MSDPTSRPVTGGNGDSDLAPTPAAGDTRTMQPVEPSRAATAEAPMAADDAVRLSPVERQLISGLSPGCALLVALDGPRSGARFLLDTDLVTVGRDSAVDILLDHVTVSRKHATFHRLNGTFTVRDLGSLNGTYVNASLVENGELRSGDLVQIGTYRLRFLHRPTGSGPGPY